MAQFINARKDIVTEAIDGFVATSGGQVARLDGYPNFRVVVRADWDKSRVAVISGGGSGHEPAHVGYVGPSMLTAAICGDIFASPSVDAILAGILAVTGDPGCLLIVKNYTGDRLNFGLAAEKARALGKTVEMVIVQDDIAIPGISRPRGVAGTLFVHKLAGTAAERGESLDTVVTVARRAAANVMSIGMSLDTCTVPGSPKEDRIPAGEIEVGLGIHGEPGAHRVPYLGARQAMEDAVSKLLPHVSANRYVALLNNLGSTTGLEMSILASELKLSAIGSKISHIVGPAALMTSLEMHGFSLTLFSLNADDEELLAAPTPISAWPGMKSFDEPKTVPFPENMSPPRATPSENPEVEDILVRCCGALIAAEADLNALDARAGDGDTGTTVANAARALLDQVEQLPFADAAELFRAVAQQLSESMGGSSGVLLAIFFAAAGDAASKGAGPLAALQAGLMRMQDVGGAGLGDRTMVDALLPALKVLPQGLVAATQAARNGADATRTMVRTSAGRAAYINADQLHGYVDPGAEAVARLFESLR